jgi:tetratricopeptide (TPR) repeat protein
MKRFLFAGTLILVPVLICLLAIELFLRATGFGYPPAPLLTVETESGKMWVGNPDFTRLYFPAGLKRLPPPNRVPVNKHPGSRRYLIVGGSAAAGDPDVDFSIARILQWILTETHPKTRWELLNLAYTACNSHVAAEVVRQSHAFDIDGLVVLVGNNEVIGPYGPGTSLTDSASSLRQQNWQIALRKTKLGQLGQTIRQHMHGSRNKPDRWRGMASFLEHRIGVDDPRLEYVYRLFRDNLRDMEQVARGRNIPAILSTVPVNLLDQPPFQDAPDSLPSELESTVLHYMETGDSSLSPESLLAEVEAFPESARLAYMAGRVFFENGHKIQADPLLRRARDLDQLRFRADSRLNEIIRQEGKREGGHWLPLEAEFPLVRDNPRHALGYPHFYEHVHFSFRANFLLAREMALTLLSYESLDASDAAVLEWSQAAKALAYTPFEAWAIFEEIEHRFAEPPFTEIPGFARLSGWMDTLRESLFDQISLADEKAAMNATYVGALRDRPDDDRIKLNYANFLRSFGRPETAMTILKEIFPRNPTDSDIAIMMFNLAVELKQPKQAGPALERIEQIFPGHPQLPSFRSEWERLADQNSR